MGQQYYCVSFSGSRAHAFTCIRLRLYFLVKYFDNNILQTLWFSTKMGSWYWGSGVQSPHQNFPLWDSVDVFGAHRRLNDLDTLNTPLQLCGSSCDITDNHKTNVFAQELTTTLRWIYHFQTKATGKANPLPLLYCPFLSSSFVFSLVPLIITLYTTFFKFIFFLMRLLSIFSPCFIHY
jgi:hypothetical protein